MKMIGVLFLIMVFFGFNQALFNVYGSRHQFLEKKRLNLIYFYHLIFFAVFLWYASNNPSDSHRYYQDLQNHAGSWFDLWGTDTRFINFVSYPFFKLGFNYEMLMVTFAWFGYIGFFYAYLFIKEKIPVTIKIFKEVDLLSLILFFPNMHFWTASLGKDALIFMALMMFTYAIIDPKKRALLLILSSVTIFHIRPHVFMFVALGVVIGYFSGKEKIAFWKKAAISSGMIISLFFVQDEILGVLGLEGSENIVKDIQSETAERADELMTSGSAVEMSDYSLPFKFFTFWFRPLFVDAQNFMGLIVSFENLVYLLLFIKIIRKDFLKFIIKSPALVKMSFFIFLMSSYALTFVMSNLGIIIRQKSMVMYFIFFVIYYYLAQKKYNKIMKLRKTRLKRKMETENKNEPVVA